MTNDNYTQWQDEQYLAKLKQILEQNPRFWLSRLSKDKCLVQWIIDKTPLLSDSIYKLSTRINWIINNRKNFPICPTCGGKIGVGKNISWSRQYQPHCCFRCAQLDINVKDKIKRTCVERYGAENVFQSQEIKERIKQVHIERLGVDNPSKSKQVLEKKRQTWMTNYGVSHPLKCKEIMNKVRQTNIERYGGPAPMCSDDVKEKMSNTCQERYGGIGLASIELGDKTIQRTIELYGKSPTELAHIAAADVVKSKNEIELDDFIKQICEGEMIQFNVRDILSNNKELDIYLPERKIAIEFNGDYWHMNPKVYKEFDFNTQLNMTAKQKWEYDELKNADCSRLGIRLIVVWEYDWTHKKDAVKKDLQIALNVV